MAERPDSSGGQQDQRRSARRRTVAGWVLSVAGALLMVLSVADTTLVQSRTNTVLRSASVVDQAKDDAARHEMDRTNLDRVGMVLGALIMVSEYATRNRRLSPERPPQPAASTAGPGPGPDPADPWDQAKAGWTLTRTDVPQPQQQGFVRWRPPPHGASRPPLPSAAWTVDVRRADQPGNRHARWRRRRP